MPNDPIKTDGISTTLNSGGSSLSSLSSTEGMSSALNSTATGLISNPISAILSKVLVKINSLTSVIEDRVNVLAEDLVKSVDHKGRVQLVGSAIVITITKKDEAELERKKTIFDSKIASINAKLNMMRGLLDALKAITTIINILKRLLDIQDMVMSLNPVFAVVKKGVKLIFLKEMIAQYANVLNSALKSNTDKLNQLIERFRHLHIEIKVQQEDDSGKHISNSVAEDQIANDLLNSTGSLNSNPDTALKQVSDEYTTNTGLVLVLKVEKYGTKALIARAYEKVSGMLVEETSPSFISTPTQLMTELKEILSISD